MQIYRVILQPTRQMLADIEGVKASGGRALRDAHRTGSEELKHAPRGILVVADGVDNSSETTAAEIAEGAKTTGVPIFAISFGISKSDDSRGAEFEHCYPGYRSQA